MATDAPPQPEAPPPSVHAAHEAPAKTPVKPSWRRKYRKMRVQFDQAITMSNRLIADEWKAMGTARRLAEGNDQLLDMLLDINEQPRAPARLRFNLDPAGTAAPVVDGPGPEAVRHQLHELRAAAASGAMAQQDYVDRAERLHSSQAIRQTLRSLARLEARVPHTTHGDVRDRPLHGIDLTDHAPGYMSPAHEEEYLAALDQALAAPGFDPSLQEGRPIRHAASHPPLSEKDLTIRNPDSVYNWLRKHQPQVFLQDKDAAHHENMSEKSAPAKPSASRKGLKRESAVGGGGGTPGPRDHDDEDSVAGETGGKGRRKIPGAGDDDTAYRPKGGSSRPPKRKREDGDTPVSKGKKKSRPSTTAA
ncbi:IEC3 subunit of the Ino80 complex, chromatin re-modelling-domain-containing protein [Ampelomyces quisqualis]|uniref:IEC3 subunit of the Ino80 complex, chromatin re-modelling-domain-containing protein n=1 Tax=Ampelomyces quisqualis TaxID=50730 RepID=A0A6A5Q9H6_AMPQU|nr:IEC3 subunit of the Ino80 complex, chromatin re-modelling-domain-containing protein [Ampelomyces quisqualis]